MISIDQINAMMFPSYIICILFEFKSNVICDAISRLTFCWMNFYYPTIFYPNC